MSCVHDQPGARTTIAAGGGLPRAEGEEGATADCTATIDGEEGTVRATVTSVDGNEVAFDIAPVE